MDKLKIQFADSAVTLVVTGPEEGALAKVRKAFESDARTIQVGNFVVNLSYVAFAELVSGEDTARPPKTIWTWESLLPYDHC